MYVLAWITWSHEIWHYLFSHTCRFPANLPVPTGAYTPENPTAQFQQKTSRFTENQQKASCVLQQKIAKTPMKVQSQHKKRARFELNMPENPYHNILFDHVVLSFFHSQFFGSHFELSSPTLRGDNCKRQVLPCCRYAFIFAALLSSILNKYKWCLSSLQVICWL